MDRPRQLRTDTESENPIMDSGRNLTRPDATQLFVANFRNVRYEDLPPEVVKITKDQVLDFFGVALGGSGEAGVCGDAGPGARVGRRPAEQHPRAGATSCRPRTPPRSTRPWPTRSTSTTSMRTPSCTRGWSPSRRRSAMSEYVGEA